MDRPFGRFEAAASPVHAQASPLGQVASANERLSCDRF